LSDEMCMQLIDAFKYENQRTNRFLDNSYFIHAQKIVGHETCYMFDFNIETCKLRVTIVNPPELDPEKVKAEAQGLEYIQQYLTTTTPNIEKARYVFLQRNKKKMSQDVVNNNITIVNGLECKICIATYKMYYVEETEDYFARKKTSKQGIRRGNKRWQQFVDKRVKELQAIKNEILAPVAVPIAPSNAMDTSQ
jgi:paired amphipathic helix protein Sin3a